MKKTTSQEQRKHLRIGLVVDIEMTLPLKGIVTVRTRDISDGGLFLILDNTEMPTVGTEVQVRLKNQLGDGEEPPIFVIATETPAAIFEMGSYRDVAHALIGMSWGAEDLPANAVAAVANSDMLGPSAVSDVAAGRHASSGIKRR